MGRYPCGICLDGCGRRAHQRWRNPGCACGPQPGSASRRRDDDRAGNRRRGTLARREAVPVGDWLLFDFEKLPVPVLCRRPLALRRPASASWVLREAKQVAPTTRLAGPEPSKSRCAPPGRPLAVTTSLNFKEPLCVLRRDFGDFLWAEAVNLGELFGDVADVGGLVALAAMRD